MHGRLELVWRVVLGAAMGLGTMGIDLVRASEPDVLYQQHCAACHGVNRTGAMGPALLPESLERLRRAEALKVITQGRVATQMKGFHETLAPEQIAQLTQWIYTPVSPAPVWADADIRASRVQFSAEQGTAIFYLSVLVLPEVLLISGLAVWWRRAS